MAQFCDRAGCVERARWEVRLVLPPPPMYDTAEPARADTGLKVCTPCRGRLQVSDVISDEGWAQLAAAFQAHGRVVPDRSKIRFDWRELEE